LLRSYTGTYRSSLGNLVIVLIDSTLYVDIYGRHELYPVGTRRFRTADGAWVIDFEEGADDASPGFVLDWGERLIRARRVE